MKEYNIKYILNVSVEIRNYYEDTLKYHKIPIRDDNCQSIQPYLKESYNVIKQFMEENNGNILVHCYMGASRSATIVANFISTETGEDITQVIDKLTNKRPIVNPTEKFVADLGSHTDTKI